MAVFDEKKHTARKIELMEKCFECYVENGLSGVGIRTLGQYCKTNPANLYTYFKDVDDIIVQSTEYCMSKVEDDFMAKAPVSLNDVWRFIDEIPYWTSEKHGKKYRLMYQVYTHPKYREHGKIFFEGVNRRYSEYSNLLADKISIPADVLRPMIFVFIRACVHFALFEDEFYLQEQLKMLKMSIKLYSEKNYGIIFKKEDF